VSLSLPEYAELHAISNFTFLRGASHPEELIAQAERLGYRALALTDECSLAGVVRAHVASQGTGCRLIIGSEIHLVDGPSVVLLATDRTAYAALCHLLTVGRRRTLKGTYRLYRSDIERGALGGLLALWLPSQDPDRIHGQWLKACFADNVWLAANLSLLGNDQHQLRQWSDVGATLAMPLVAVGSVWLHRRERQPLQDVLTAIRLRQPLAQLGHALQPNAERYLKARGQLLHRYPAALLAETLAIAERCQFSLSVLRYEYPDELVPPGHTPTSWLRVLTERGLQRRFPLGVSESLRCLIERELALIADLAYEPFFLTVEDLVGFARTRGILCQGRGSAANSAVCYCLGITEVDPSRMSVLFERFLSKERNEPPDIDVDFEHDRREEVIQYLYQKYGRERAALAATVICYRPRSAIKDVGRALGLDPPLIERLASHLRAQSAEGDATADDARLQTEGINPSHPLIERALRMARELLGFPRHLSQHVGGFVIARHSLSALVPVENASMSERTVIQWDKDDLHALGLLKVDVLALGMLSAIRRALALVGERIGSDFGIADIPPEDPLTYLMISKADTIGVFQIESRAQMAMLPRLKPRCYYDLVIEIALIRPGPIQGGMVHPYLRRRQGLEAVSYPSAEVQSVLERTLGVPIFQEQVMQLAMVAAGFSAGEADQLRRSMAAWKRRGGLAHFEGRLLQGMQSRGYTADFAASIFKQITGFGEYGFPESHAASFALLVYVSAWLKCHQPAAFTAALLNSQPMGFYSAAQLVRDVKEHGVSVLPVEVGSSLGEASLCGEPPAVRLGFNQVRGLTTAAVQRMLAARTGSPFVSVHDLAERARLDRRDLAALAAAGALKTLAGDRHQALWQVSGFLPSPPLWQGVAEAQGVPLLRVPLEGEDIVADYRHLGLTLGRHPLALLRPRLQRRRVLAAAELIHQAVDTSIRVCGLVLMRQRPGSASGVTFVTLEDETGVVNLIVWRSVGSAWRQALLESRLLEARGRLQREGIVQHVVVDALFDRSRHLGALLTPSRDFH
jgi:error-prone DNA polymerase